MRNVLYRCVWCSKSRIFKLIFSPKDDTMPNYDDWHVPLLFKFIITTVLTFWESLTLRVTWEWCFLAVWCFLACFFPEKSRYFLKKYFSNIWPCFWVPKLHFINFTQICWWFVKNTSAHWHHVGLPQLHFFFFYLTLYKRMEVAEVNNSQSNQYGEETLRNSLFAGFQKLCTNTYVAEHKIVKSA